MTALKQYCTFFLGDLFLGVEVAHVQEVVRFQEMTRVPLAPEEVKGLINLRGQIVVAIDLRRRLGISPLEEGKLSSNVLLKTKDGTVSLMVDEIGDVIEVTEDLYEPAPETLVGIVRSLAQGVYKLEKRLLLVLDTEKTVNLDPEITNEERKS